MHVINHCLLVIVYRLKRPYYFKGTALRKRVLDAGYLLEELDPQAVLL